MSEESARRIKDYLTINGPDPDNIVREIAAARLWQTGDPRNQAAAEAIWGNLGTPVEEIRELKDDYAPLKK